MAKATRLSCASFRLDSPASLDAMHGYVGGFAGGLSMVAASNGVNGMASLRMGADCGASVVVVMLQLFLECWLLGSLRTFCNFFLKITLKFSVLMLKSQLNTYFYKSE